MRDGIRTGCGLLEVVVPQIVMFGMCFDFYNTPPQVIYNQAEHQNRSLIHDLTIFVCGCRQRCGPVHPTHIQRVSNAYPTHIQHISNVYPMCIQCVSNAYPPTRIQRVSYIFRMRLDCQSASKKKGMILIVRSLVFDNFHTWSADLDIELCLESDLDSQKLDIEGESTLDSSQSSISVNRLDIGPISRLDGLLCGKAVYAI
jgi:hypothetical protein